MELHRRRRFEDVCTSLASHTPSRVCLDKSVGKHGSYIRHPLLWLSLGAERLAVTELHGAACVRTLTTLSAREPDHENRREAGKDVKFGERKNAQANVLWIEKGLAWIVSAPTAQRNESLTDSQRSSELFSQKCRGSM